MGHVRRRFSRDFTGNASASMPNSSMSAWCIAPERCSMKQTSTGDENAIVDFKYSPSPRITWWFDHHQSAFLTPDDASHFEQDISNTKFYDPDYRSCTKFIAEVTKQRFGFNPDPVAELVEWADIIDGALYSDPQTAVEMKEPAMKLTMVIESNQDAGFIPKLIEMLAYKPLAEIISYARDRGADSGADGSPPQIDRNPARAYRVQGRHRLFRRHRPRTRGLQQVHSVLSESELHLQRRPEQEQLSGRRCRWGRIRGRRWSRW